VLITHLKPACDKMATGDDDKDLYIDIYGENHLVCLYIYKNNLVCL